MKNPKKFFISLLASLSSLLCAFALASCADQQNSSNSAGHIHNWEVVEIKPTCTEQGYTCYSCVCGRKKEDNFIDALGHDFSEAGCSRCSITFSTGLDYRLSGDKSYYILCGIGDCIDQNLIVPYFYDGLPIKEIANLAFCESSQVKTVVLPDCITLIGSSAFRDCNRLSSIVIPDSVLVIEGMAFNDCDSLSEIVIGNGVCEIFGDVFEGTKYYKDLKNWQDGALYIGDYLIKARTSIPRFYEIKEGTKCIAGKAFSDCTNLTTVKIPDSVTTIGNSAFKGCTNLTSVIIPDSVVKIGSMAFEYCSLTKVVIGVSVNLICDWAFNNCGKVETVYYKGNSEQWGKIKIGENYTGTNYSLTNPTRYYYSETQPVTTGNYWRYDESGNPVIW